jgi:hypothetical protein
MDLKLSRNGPAFCGALYSSDRGGFAKLIAEANEAYRIGYVLVGVERVGSQLGVIYHRASPTSAATAPLTGE